MKKSQALIGLLAITSLTSPALAHGRDSAIAWNYDQSQAQSSMFAGVAYRVGFNRAAGERRGRANLAIGSMTHRPSASEIRIGQGLEITRGKTGKVAIHIGGRDMGQVPKSAKLSGGETALIVGGLILAVAVAALIAASAGCYDEDQKAQCD